MYAMGMRKYNSTVEHDFYKKFPILEQAKKLPQKGDPISKDSY